MVRFSESDKFYETLGIPETATQIEVKAAYRRKLQAYFSYENSACRKKDAIKCWKESERYSPYSLLGERECSKIRHAYNILSDPKLRCLYADFVASGECISDRFWMPRLASGGMLMAQGAIEGQTVNAIPDTGAGCNLMSSSLAKGLGLEPPPGLPEAQDTGLRMANGKTIMSAGTINAVWNFAYDPDKSWNIAFQVINDLAHDVILGSEFLTTSGTMNQYRARLSGAPRPPWAKSFLLISSVGSVSQRLQGRIGDVAVLALADSGSESNLVSSSFARRHTNWHDTIDWNDQRLLRFPNGNVEKTMGSAWAHWACMGQSGSPLSRDDAVFQFHILESCIHDVILGQKALEEIKAFTDQIASFVEFDQGPEPADFNLVIWVPAEDPKTDQATDAGANPQQNHQTSNEHSEGAPQSQTSESLLGPRVSKTSELPDARESEYSWWFRRLAERKRQFAARRHILQMSPGPDRDAAAAKEQEIRRVFKAREKSILPKQAPQQPTFDDYSAQEMQGEGSVNHKGRIRRFFSR
ncbi:hypothetical protein JMJ77_0009353 [Colletotrichum scovillei]|uniref:J domain-containing protein n=1 Tax=Colletotrichum scovillei TaxID=1209932 RepID=A0A9P7QZ81_9PEZI|nr:hypothetical protein JMJ77_0009353 [Colletotrichum scovillei]KAG7052432.1 hypothetical protein JMJ78_0005449 [Colletotrichum scovillei]KAG7064692.1 hypothetical protein JMJ76_0012452 [Colletotrichum scovillei]